MTIRFDEAWSQALNISANAERNGLSVVLVRDIVGRITVVLDDRIATPDGDSLSSLQERLSEELGPFTSSTPILHASDMLQPDIVLSASDLLHVSADDDSIVRVLERGVVGADWKRIKHVGNTFRIVLYGFKGGVGRSTATLMLAQHLAMMNLCVLVADLDLESPGVASLVHSSDHLPDHGLVDYLVESMIGNTDGLNLVVRSSVVSPPGNGEVWLAPAGGRPRRSYDYLAKLNRIYAEVGVAGEATSTHGFGQRLASAIAECERQVADLSRVPDVVLLDSRAGIHDVAAVAITQLSDISLLFASNSGTTWNGYEILLSQWSTIPSLAEEIRQRIKMVASMVPPRSESEYLDDFRDRAQACFAKTLYDDVLSGGEEGYNPGPSDESAPHAPLPILFVSDLVGVDTSQETSWMQSELIIGAYRNFLDGVTLLLPERE